MQPSLRDASYDPKAVDELYQLYAKACKEHEIKENSDYTQETRMVRVFLTNRLRA